MPTLFCRRVGNALFPDGPESQSELSRIPFDRLVKVEVKQSRNVQQHRLFWALAKRIADGIGREAEEIVTVFKFATNHTETIKSKKYGTIVVPKSISFAALDGLEFSRFMEACIKVAYEEWQIPPEALEDLLVPQVAQRRA